MRIFDLRSAAERKQVPLGGAETVAAGNFTDQLEVLLPRLQQPVKRSFEQLNAPVPTLLVLPAGVSAAELYHTSLWNLPGDVRILEGAYWADPEGETRAVNSGGCMTCPGG